MKNSKCWKNSVKIGTKVFLQANFIRLLALCRSNYALQKQYKILRGQLCSNTLNLILLFMSHFLKSPMLHVYLMTHMCLLPCRDQISTLEVHIFPAKIEICSEQLWRQGRALIISQEKMYLLFEVPLEVLIWVMVPDN